MARPGLPALALAALAWLGPALAEEPPIPPDRPSTPLDAAPESEPPPPDRKTLCDLVETAAGDHALPIGFFARLIRAESSFDPTAVSPKGAQGIAQFMRGTADMRGLADPFDAESAIAASAAYLEDLMARYGNLGLAAAAYNAGEARVSNWIAGRGGLPLETRNYVWKITGRAPEDWLDALEADEIPAGEDEDAEDTEDCMTIASSAGAAAPTSLGTVAPTAPWGVQLAGNYSLSRAMASYRRLQSQHPKLLGEVEPMLVTGKIGGRGPRPFHRLQAPADSRQEAQRLCEQLRARGGSCLVLRNR